MNIQRLDEAGRKMLSAAIAGSDWIDHLESMMDAMGALGGGPTRIALPDIYAMPTRGVQASMRDYKSGNHPPLSMDLLVPVSAGAGFVADYASSVYDARRRHPFFHEFLRPRDLYHQAAAFLDETDAGSLRFLVFRERRKGRFEPDEIETLSRHLPYLRSVAMVSRATLKTMARRRAEPFDQRGEAVFYLDARGRVIETNAAADAATEHALAIARRRLTTAWPPDQARFDRALAVALENERPSLVTLQGGAFAKATMALVLPISGEAKDVFGAPAAVVVLLGPSVRDHREAPVAATLLGGAVGLTAREADVVRLVGSGHTPREAAVELAIGYGTLRGYLKGAFGKLGVHSQAELVGLVKRLH